MDYTQWHVGMKVVCIASPERIAEGLRDNPGSSYPAHNRVYTIREIRDDTALRNPGVVVLLAEICNRSFIGKSGPGWHCWKEPGFPARGFRPVERRKTDISVFTAMLTPSLVEPPPSADPVREVAQ